MKPSVTISPLLTKVLDSARWAPSGDNVQCWRFEITGEHTFVIHGKDTSDHVVYDLEGHASWLAVGCLLEAIDLSAAHEGYEAVFQHIDCELPQEIRIGVELSERPGIAQDPLYSQIIRRCVQRKPMGTTPLSSAEKKAFEQSLPNGFEVIWLEGDRVKQQVAKFMYGNADTRYSMKEGYEVHSKIIDWRPECRRYSPDLIPPLALGLDAINIALTKWSLKSWSRFHFLEKYLAGTVLPRLLMDYRTSIKCSAHFVIVGDKTAKSQWDYHNAGRAVYRFWLTAAQLNLGFQPEQTPVIFSEYIRNGVEFSENPYTNQNADKMDQVFKQLIGEDKVQRSVYMGRVGRSELPTSRSVRKPLTELLL
ncbi:molybdopterin/thiamine biosynthesis family protein [Catenovulum agarivorans DS-2]|uniref:Molybdopterin/thiamine biosynthesis family protein n=1 Tax=Catenovulum agarivorans DS-2 TaxID=1328313 RepID=W7QGX6_9ALTE|nr:hypothetical protein [Catenovulum agarivorans]EWH11131.1 molybdopterin/thiamine biosynthesis family protein [Catenovulum agarivorans DS-2]